MGLKHRWGYDLDNGSEEIKRFLEEFAEPDQEQVTDGRACTPAQARTRVHRYLDGLSWVVTFGVIAVMVLRMMPNGLDGKRYIPLIVAFVPWMAVLSAAILLISLISRRIRAMDRLMPRRSSRRCVNSMWRYWRCKS